MDEKNGLKSRLDHLEHRLEDHLSSAGLRFTEMSEFRGNMQARIVGLENSVSDLRDTVITQTQKIEQMNRRLAYYAGAIAVAIFILNLLSPQISKLIGA